MIIDQPTINTLRRLAEQTAELKQHAGVEPATLLALLAGYEERDKLAAHVARCTRFLEDMHIMPTDWTIKESVNLKTAAPAASLEERDQLKHCEGMKTAAKLIADKAKAYHEEHGRTDPETGHCEYPGDGDDYYNEMMELAEEIQEQAEKSPYYSLLAGGGSSGGGH
jgi:hypothetical protein